MIEAIKEYFGYIPMATKPVVIVIAVPPMMRKGEYDDVIAIRHPLESFRKFTNVPYVMGDLVDGGDGYEWGYTGCGPTDFAFNTLLHFTDHDEAVARAFHTHFRDEFLWHMPKEGGRIPKEVIFDFLQKMKITRPQLLADVRRGFDAIAKVRHAVIAAENLPGTPKE